MVSEGGAKFKTRLHPQNQRHDTGRCSEELTWNTGTKLVGELRYQVVVDPVLHGSKDDDGASVVDCQREREEQGQNLRPDLVRLGTLAQSQCLLLFRVDFTDFNHILVVS